MTVAKTIIPGEPAEFEENGQPDSIHSFRDSSEKKRKLEFRSAHDRTHTEIPKVEWLVDDLLPLKCLTLLSGLPKASGKTTFVTWLVSSIIAGSKFLERSCVSSPVVFLSEQSEAAFIENYLGPAKLQMSKDLFLLLGHEGLRENWTKIIPATIEKCLEIGARLFVIDTFSAFARLPGDTENDSGRIIKAVSPLNIAVSEHPISIVLNHHDRKCGGTPYEAARGSGALLAVVDLIFQLKRRGGSGMENVRVLSSGGRYASIPNQQVIELTDDGYVVRHDLMKNGSDIEIQIVEFLRSRGKSGATRIDMQRDVGSATSSVFRVIKKLEGQEVITATGKGTRGDPHRYVLIED